MKPNTSSIVTPPIHHFPPLSSCLSRYMHIRTQFSFFSFFLPFRILKKKSLHACLLFHQILHAFLLIVVVITTFSSIDHHFRLHVCKCSSNEHQPILYVVLWCCIVMLGPTTSAKRPDVVCITFEMSGSQFRTVKPPNNVAM